MFKSLKKTHKNTNKIEKKDQSTQTDYNHTENTWENILPKIKNNPALDRSVQASQAYKDLEEEINRAN